MSEPSWLLEMADPAQPSGAGDEPDWLKDMAEPVEAAPAAQEGERPGFFSQVGNQLLSGDANEMATGYATTINELRNYDTLPWYKRAKYPSDPVEREAQVNELLPELERWTGNIAQYESERAAPTAGQRAISEAPTLGAALKTAVSNPGDALGLVGPSAAASLIDLPQVVAAGLTMGPKGAATAAGVSAYGQDYKASVLDGLRDIGVDPSSAPMLMEAMQKADALIASQEAAKKRAMVVGGASALGTAVAGKMLTPFMKAGVGREVANVGVQIPTQAVIEGGGEALAQQASGEGYKPGEVAAEMLGGGVTAPVEVGQAALGKYKEKGPDTQGLAAAAQARAAYEATFTETDDGQGGSTFVDGAGLPVGDTLDEARATAARLTPAEIAGRMQAVPAAGEADLGLRTPTAQPRPNVSELPPGYMEAAAQAPLEPLRTPTDADTQTPGSGSISDAELAGAGVDTSELGPLERPSYVAPGKAEIPARDLKDAAEREQALPELEPVRAPVEAQPTITDAELAGAGIDTQELGEVAAPTAEPKAAAAKVAGIPRPTNVQDDTFDVNGEPAEIRKLYEVKGGVRIKNGLRFPKKLLPEFEQRAEAISAAPPVDTSTLGEVAPLEPSNEAGARQSATDIPASGAGSAVRLSGRGAADGNSPVVGSGPDMGRVPDERDAGGGTAGSVEAGSATPSVVDARREPDEALNLNGKSRIDEARDYLVNNKVSLDYPASRIAEITGLTEQEAASVVADLRANPPTTPTERQDGTTSVAEDGMTLVHGSNRADLTPAAIEIVRNDGQKQGKKGRVYGGFYAAPESDAAQAVNYANMGGGTPTVYDVRVKPGTKVLNKTGDITRLSEAYINELASQGYGVVVGKSPLGRTEYVIIDKNAIESMAPRAKPASPMLRGKTKQAQPAPAAQPAAAPTQEQRNEEVPAQGQEPQGNGTSGSQVRGEQAQAQEEVGSVEDDYRAILGDLESDSDGVSRRDDIQRRRSVVPDLDGTYIAFHSPTKGEISGTPSVEVGSDADVLGKGFYIGDYNMASGYGKAKPYLLRGKFAPMEKWVAALKQAKYDRPKAREALKAQGYVGVYGRDTGVVWDDAAFVTPAEPAAEFTSDTGTAPDAAPATSEAWKGKKGAARLQALVEKSKDVAPDAYEDARLPGYMGEAVEAMARLFKKNVVVFRAKAGTAYAPGGLLFPADPSTIYLNADANVAPAVVFMHEMVHSMKRTDAKTYAALEKAVGKLLKNKKGYVEFRLRGKKLSDELVTEEMIADVMADHASTPQFWSDLYERFNDKSAWAKFVEHVRLLLSNVIDTLYPIGANNYVSDFNAAYQAVVDAAYNHARSQHGDTASAVDAPLESAMLSSTHGSPPAQSLLDEGNAYWRAGAKMWDNLNRMRILQEKAVERGLKLKDEMNVWVRENLSRSKMRVMADDVTEKFQEPILKTMKQASLTLKQVDDYLMALHAPERNAQVASINPKFPDGGSGMTNAEAAATLAAFTPAQTTALQSISQKVKDLQAYKLNVMEQYGLMEPSDIQRLQAMYQHYVPLKTIDEEQTLPGQTGRGLDIRGAEVKAALGRGSRATSPLMVSFQDMARTLVRAHKNEAGNALLELTRDPVLASMRTPQGKPIISIANPADFARPVTDSQGNVSVAVPGNWWQDEEVFITKENGVPQYIHVRDAELMAQLRRMGDSEMGPAIRAIGQGTRLFARMLTQYNPVFAPVNIIRDAIQASILSLGVPGLNPVKVMAGILPNLGRIMAHKLSPNTRYQEFLEDGGSTNAYGLNDLNDALADVQALGISLGYGMPSTGKWDAAWKAINAKRLALAKTPVSKSVFGTLTWWNEAFENAVRLSTYNAMRDAGISRDQAAFQSKELSTNFNKKGTLSSALNAVYVFVNAAMQGNRALVRFWKESGKVKTAFAGLVFAGVMQDILGSLFGGDDDESGLANIDEVGDWALDHNIVLPTGQNEQVKIPLPYGINLPFVLGRRISKAIRTGDGLSQMSGILNVMADNFSPIGGFEAVKDQKTGDLAVAATFFKTLMPSLMRPGFSVVVNSNFMGAPIAKEPFQGDKSPAPRAYDFKPGTADYAVKLSELMNEWSGGNVARPGDVNVSPEHIQYLIGEYSGGAGRFVSDVTDMTTKAVKGKSEDIDFSKAPFVRSFFSTDSRSDAYSRYREISTRVAYLKDEKAARVETDPKYRAIAKTVDRAEDELKILRKLRKAAYAKDDMAKVREIQEKETTIIKGVVKRFNSQNQ